MSQILEGKHTCHEEMCSCIPDFGRSAILCHGLMASVFFEAADGKALL